MALIEFDMRRVNFLPHRQLRPRGPHPNPEHWESIRQQALGRDGHQCRVCEAKAGDHYDGCPPVRLEVHHRHYRNWGNEQLDDVTTLCECHHRVITDAFMRDRDQARVVGHVVCKEQSPESLPARSSGQAAITTAPITPVESVPSSNS